MTDESSSQIGTTVKYLPFGEARAAIDIPTDKLFTGQRLDSIGLYYYNARYYDATIGRFISPDTIIPHPANPQSLNRYSYCLNNPLKYIDPTGHKVQIGGFDVSNILAAIAAGRIANVAMALNNAGVTNLWGAYAAFRSAAPELTGELEASSEVINIQLGTPSNGWAAQYDRQINTITLVENNNDLFSHKSILDFAHEARHAWQDVVAFGQAKTDFDKRKWLDTVYLEWDAYKYQADLDDRLGWGIYGGLWNQQKFFQALDVENNWNDYNRALHRFVLSRWDRLCWWKIYTPEIYSMLTEDDYTNR